MRKRSRQLAVVVALVATLVGCKPNGNAPGDSQRLTIFAAASLADALTATGEAFAQVHGTTPYFNFASSGTLAMQLEASGEAHLFLSASEAWMDRAVEAGSVDPTSRTTFLANQLVVVGTTGNGVRIAQPADLAMADFAYLSIGDPAHVPAGQYARSWLQSQSTPTGSLWDALQGRLLPATDVRGALAQVEASADILGIVYRSDYLARQTEMRLLYAVPVETGPPIRYVAAVTQRHRDSAAARAFLSFLGSPEAARIFAAQGFLPWSEAP